MSERELFNEWIKHYEKYDVKIDQLQRAFMWQAWQASANREGYKLAPIEPTYEMIENAIGYDGHIESIYKAMIGAIE